MRKRWPTRIRKKVSSRCERATRARARGRAATAWARGRARRRPVSRTRRGGGASRRARRACAAAHLVDDALLLGRERLPLVQLVQRHADLVRDLDGRRLGRVQDARERLLVRKRARLGAGEQQRGDLPVRRLGVLDRWVLRDAERQLAQLHRAVREPYPQLAPQELSVEQRLLGRRVVARPEEVVERDGGGGLARELLQLLLEVARRLELGERRGLGHPRRVVHNRFGKQPWRQLQPHARRLGLKDGRAECASAQRRQGRRGGQAHHWRRKPVHGEAQHGTRSLLRAASTTGRTSHSARHAVFRQRVVVTSNWARWACLPSHTYGG